MFRDCREEEQAFFYFLPAVFRKASNRFALVGSSDARAGEGAFASALGFDEDLGGDALFEGTDMRNDADEFAFLVEGGKSTEGGFQGFFIEGAEALVEEERIDAGGVARHFREAEGEGEAGEEAFAAGEVFGGTDFVGLEVVDDIEFERVTGGADERVAGGHLVELLVGENDHFFEGEPLGKITEFIAVGRTDETVQLLPTGGFLFLRFGGNDFGLDAL